MFPLVSLATDRARSCSSAWRASSRSPTLLVGGFFLGIGGTTFAVGVPFVNAWFPPQRRGLAIGIFGAGMGGTAISALTTVKLVDGRGRRHPFVITAVVLAVYAVVAWLLLRDAPGRAVPTESLATRLGAAARLPITWQACLLYAVGVRRLRRVLGLPAGVPQDRLRARARPTRPTGWPASSCWPCSCGRSAAGCPTGSGRCRCWPAPSPSSTVGAAVQAFTPPLMPLGTIAFLAMAAALGAGSGATFALVAQVAPAAKVGSVTGLVGAAGGLGGFVPPLVMGFVYGRTGSLRRRPGPAGRRRRRDAAAHADRGPLRRRGAAPRPAARAGRIRELRPRTSTAPSGRTPSRDEHRAAGHAPSLDDPLTRGPGLAPAGSSPGPRSRPTCARCTRSAAARRTAFYRDRWSHDKVVRSTHGVNCTGSCSWKVYVKDGIITWESQQTDYPSVGPDRPEYEPRGCPRGAAFSWYTYSPTRVRYPYVRGVLLEMYREARARLGDPVLAWADVVDDPERARRYKAARGKGGLVRASWEEATEIVAAAHVHTIKALGPGPRRRVLADPGDVDGVARRGRPLRQPHRRLDAVSFYDWYADLPVASPAGVRRPDRRARVRGLVGRRLPDHVGLQPAGHPHPGRALDDRGALPGAEGHRGRAGLRRQRQVRRRVAAGPPGHRRGAGDGDGPRHPHGVLRRPAGALLHRLRVRATPTCRSWSGSSRARADGSSYVPGKFLTAEDLAGDEAASENAAFKTVLLDAAHRRARRPQRLAGAPLRRRGRRAGGTSTSATSTPLLSADRRRRAAGDRAAAPVRRARRRGRGPRARRARPPGERAPGHHRVRPAAGPVRRRAGRPARARGPRGYDDADAAVHARVAGAHHRGAGGSGRAGRSRVRRQRRGVARSLDDHHGRRHQPLVPLRHHLPRVPDPDQPHRLPGRQRRRVGALRRPGEGPPDHRLHPARQRASTGRARRAT